jgi:rhodanese-related sulfurtransferase
VNATEQRPRIKTISPAELAKLKMQGNHCEMIDVRTPVEYRTVHAEGAALVPLDQLDPVAVLAARKGSGEPIYVICKSGARATKACERFVDAGFDDAICVEGGTSAWEAAGLPVQRSKGVIPLERQVFIAAGFLVLSGVLLGVFVNHWFYVLSGFVGAGLMFAGITGICGMAMLLARMPWNRRAS